MLLYDNRSLFRLVFATYGSIFLKLDNIFFAIVIAGAAAILQELVDGENKYAPKLPHHYGMHALGGMIVIALVFRTNQGWGRYWEAVGQLHLMYSKWGDAFAQIFAFSQVSIMRARATNEPADLEKCKRLEALLDSLTNNFILLSAIAAHRLSNGDVQKIEEKVRWSEQILKREVLQRDKMQFPAFKAVGKTAGPAEMVLKAPTMHLAGSKTTDSKSSSGSKHQRYDLRNYLVVRQVPSDDERLLLEQSTDPASVVMYWIVHDLAEISKDLAIAPPIQTRMYQELSNGMLGFNQCVKLADVPFPFPYAQVLTYCLVCYTAFIPVYIVCFTSSRIVDPILAFALFQGIWGLNETAKELENPFGPDDNDITLIDFHLRFMDQCEEILEAHETMQNEGAQSASPSLANSQPIAPATKGSPR